MRNKKLISQLTAIILVLSMLMLTSCKKAPINGEETETGDNTPIPVYTDTSENVKKSETVFVNLDNSGAVSKISVSDWLHADRGNISIKDKTILKDFDVTKGAASAVNENGDITWQMTTSDVYYEGECDKELPVSVTIDYYLNGNKMSAEEIAGKSGNVKMEITLKNNISKEVEVNGEKHTMYAPFVTIGGMILNYENFSNIEVSGGMTVGGGTYEMVALVGAPGINESLQLDKLDIPGMENYEFPEKFTITATTENFALSDGYFIVAPLSSLSLDVGLPKTLEDAKSILSEIRDMQKLLEQIDPENVLISYISDGEKIIEMMDVMQKGLKMYNENKALINAMSEYMTPDNIKKLSDFMAGIDPEQMQSMVGILSNVPGLKSAVDSLLQLSTGLDEIMPILEGFSKALEDPEVAKALENLPQTLEVMNELMTYLNENEAVLDVMSQLMASENMGALTDSLDTAIGNIDGVSTDGGDFSKASKALVDLMEKWIGLDYGIYTAAPDYMKTSCTFIYKTDPLKAAA